MNVTVNVKAKKGKHQQLCNWLLAHNLNITCSSPDWYKSIVPEKLIAQLSNMADSLIIESDKNE